MQHNVVAPSVGESITEVSILKWAKPDGAQVKPGDLLLEIESDKATVEIVSEYSGKLTIGVQAGERILIGAVIGNIDDAAQGTASAAAPNAAPSGGAAKAQAPAAAASLSGNAASTSGPAARKMAAETGVDLNQVAGTGKDGRVTKGDLQTHASGATSGATAAGPAQSAATTQAKAPAASTPQLKDRVGDRRVPMSNLRARIAERLVQAQHTAAILTTFNEVDMGPINDLRTKHKDAYKAKHGVGLSYMSFFSRACVESFKVVPEVNASIDGRDIVYHDYIDLGIAVGSDRGLVVPIVKDAHKMGFVDIDKKIAELATKGRDGKLSIADLTGGTFTITNGGTYGSLLSTPILTPPQTAILGMHKIQDRPMAINGKVEIRPMMYLALSYDHRIIDGKGAVTFLVTLKDFLEHPEKLGLEF
jgi:2-oxoglutarate dehydrogenase E2 component (dihydrolipoamide succinyltransferase)